MVPFDLFREDLISSGKRFKKEKKNVASGKDDALPNGVDENRPPCGGLLPEPLTRRREPHTLSRLLAACTSATVV
jgi:hypothetical protein